MSWKKSRWGREKRTKTKPIGIKKRSPDQVLEETRLFINNLKPKSNSLVIFTAEEIAGHLKVKTHQVRQALHKLNLEGLVSQKINRPSHDSNRDPWTFGHGDSGWAASYYVKEK